MGHRPPRADPTLNRRIRAVPDEELRARLRKRRSPFRSRRALAYAACLELIRRHEVALDNDPAVPTNDYQVWDAPARPKPLVHDEAHEALDAYIAEVEELGADARDPSQFRNGSLVTWPDKAKGLSISIGDDGVEVIEEKARQQELYRAAVQERALEAAASVPRPPWRT